MDQNKPKLRAPALGNISCSHMFAAQMSKPRETWKVIAGKPKAKAWRPYTIHKRNMKIRGFKLAKELQWSLQYLRFGYAMKSDFLKRGMACDALLLELC